MSGENIYVIWESYVFVYPCKDITSFPWQNSMNLFELPSKHMSGENIYVIWESYVFVYPCKDITSFPWQNSMNLFELPSKHILSLRGLSQKNVMSPISRRPVARSLRFWALSCRDGRSHLRRWVSRRWFSRAWRERGLTSNKGGMFCRNWRRHFIIEICIFWVVPPPRMPVTTRIITFLVGDRYKPSFATVTGRGDNPMYIMKF